MASDEYRKYCIAKIAEDHVGVAKLRTRYPNLQIIWDFWGDIYSFDRRLDEIKYFRQWFMLNYFKFHKISFKDVQVVWAGEKIVAKEGIVYCTVPRKMDKNTAARLYKSTRKELISVANKAVGDYVLKLNKNPSFSIKKANQFERELDVIYWRRFRGLSSVQVVSMAYRKRKPAWDEFRLTVKKCAIDAGVTRLKDLDRETMNSAVRHIDRLNQKGQKIIYALLNDEFSFPEDASPY
ncbi:MAG: hypothetical protein WD071_10830 [Pseudohongiella sp.]|uniref:hypothetical protein n=1 Tax=Pseudohongiella sp. TaxID=1979412 RepID=UPI0034A0577D